MNHAITKKRGPSGNMTIKDYGLHIKLGTLAILISVIGSGAFWYATESFRIVRVEDLAARNEIAIEELKEKEDVRHREEIAVRGMIQQSLARIEGKLGINN